MRLDQLPDWRANESLSSACSLVFLLSLWSPEDTSLLLSSRFAALLHMDGETLYIWIFHSFGLRTSLRLTSSRYSCQQ